MSTTRFAVRAVNLSDNRQPDLYASSTIPFAFALVSVLLRFWCRQTNRAGLKLDDWLILTALVRSPSHSSLSKDRIANLWSRLALPGFWLLCYGVRRIID
jgi:hypothetical protein